MSSTYGESLKLSIFGQSHGAAIGMTLDGIPAGLPVDTDLLQTFLNRRAPGQNDWSTPRREEDQPEFLGGILDGFTCGAPIAAVIRNTNTRSGDYDNLKDCPRPGHADFTAQVKYDGFQDAAGGGHFSGRLTAPLCIAGGLCKQWLEEKGIQIGAHILAIGECGDYYFDPMDPEIESIGDDFPVLNPEAGIAMLSGVAPESQTAQLSKAFSSGELTRMMELIQNCAAGFTRSASRRMDAELCLMELCQPELSLDAKALNARLTRLEEQIKSGAFVAAAPQKKAKREVPEDLYDEDDRPPMPGDDDAPPAMEEDLPPDR